MNIQFSNQPSLSKPLYHYTSQAGLLGIIRDRKLWATNLLFLNDSMEFNYAVQILQESIEKLKSKGELNQEEVQYLENSSEMLSRFNVATIYQEYSGIYVCSFSEDPDKLSQWRGYCSSGSGYSIGFDFESPLEFIIAEQDFMLIKCEYDEAAHIELIEGFLKRALGYFHDNGNDIWRSWKIWGEFLALAPKIKHPKFVEEQEWRLISGPKTLEFSNVKFRAGKSMLVPYMEIELTERQDNPKNRLPLSCISKVYLGPTLHPDLSRIALESMLENEQVYKEVEADGKKRKVKCSVVESSIPYRVYY